MTKLAALAAGVVFLLALSGCTTSAASPILSKVPGCSGIWTGSGSAADNNTTAEGGCTVGGGTSLHLYAWPTWDTTDEESYIYQTADEPVNGCDPRSDSAPGTGNDCIMGSTSAYLWFITLDTADYAPSYATSLASPIVNALHGQLITNAPSSWCSTDDCAPVAASPPAAQSASPPPSSSPSPSPSPSAPPQASLPPQVPVPTSPALAPTSASGAWCAATASVYDARYNWNNVYVHSNQPYKDATASADGYSFGYETNGSGYALIYLNGPPPGTEITVTVGGATCTASD